MRTTRNILLGLTAFVVGIMTIQAENNWVSIGPSDVPGRVLAIHVDNNNPSIIYAGTAGGGLWITNNGGSSWRRCENYNGSAAVSALAQGNDGRLFIGTGEGLNPRYAIPGVKTNIEAYGITGSGVYVSDDQGATFSQPAASTASWREINSMAYDKQNNKLYVATNAGLQVSTDNGNTFSQVSGLTGRAFDVKTGSDGSVICALFGDVRVSKDNGNSFTSVCGTGTGKIPTSVMINGKASSLGRISVAIAPSDPNVMYAMAASSGDNGLFAGVYVSVDKGTSWRVVFKHGGEESPLYKNGEYRNTLAVYPTNPDRVLLGSTHLYELIKTDAKHEGEYLYQQQVLQYNMGVHAISYSGTNVYMTTSKGIWSFTNGMFSKTSRALGNLQVYSMSVGNDGRLLLGTRENGSIYVRNPKNWDAHSKSLEGYNSDGFKSALSMLKADALYYFGEERGDTTAIYNVGYRKASVESDAQGTSLWLGSGETVLTDDNGRLHWATEENAKRVSPMLFWESINDTNSKDTVIYIADKNYAPGDTICAKSATGRYPIWITNTNTDTLHTKDTLLVHDIITSRLFLGGSGFSRSVNFGAPVYMSLTALNFEVEQKWTCVFRTEDITEQVVDMVVSKDGNYLFILTKNSGGDYAIYRVSGFDTYRDLGDISVLLPSGAFQLNTGRMLVDDIIIAQGDVMDAILSIALDPQNDDNLIFTTNGSSSRINLIENATTVTNATPVDKSGSGLPNNLPVYTAIIVDSLPDVAYIGTERGVYKTDNFTASSPAWASYNTGINIDVPVFKLYQQTKTLASNYSVIYEGTAPTYIDFQGITNYGNIYAATHGAGVFVDSTYWKQTNIVNRPPIVNRIDNKIKIYPNPVTSSLSIEYVLQSNEPVQLNIVDVMGKVVYTENLGTRESGAYSETLDCSNLPNGFYFVNMVLGKQTKVAKFVVFK